MATLAKRLLVDFPKEYELFSTAGASLLAEATDLVDTARDLELRLKALRARLTGGTVKSQHNEPDQISIMSRAFSASSGMRSTYGPTKTQRQDYKIAQTEFQAIQGQIRQLIETDFANLQKQLDAARVPWTAGRPLPR